MSACTAKPRSVVCTHVLQTSDMSSLSEEHREELEETFALFDKKKGRLGVQELGGFLRYMGQNLPNADIVALAGPHGIDRAGVLEWYSKRVVPDESPGDVLKAFEVFDRDGNGLISTVELRHVLTGLGERLDLAQVEELLRNADQGDGMVNYATFVQTMVDNAKRY